MKKVRDYEDPAADKEKTKTPNMIHPLNHFLSHKLLYSTENLTCTINTQEHFNWQDIPAFI